MPKLIHKTPAKLKFVGFRMPEDLYPILCQLAEEDARSITGELVTLIRHAAIEKNLLPSATRTPPLAPAPGATH